MQVLHDCRFTHPTDEESGVVGFLRTAILGVAATCLLAAKDDVFAGKWVIDKSASTATAEIPDGLTQQVKKKGEGLAIETYWKEPRSGMAPLVLLGIMTTNLKLDLNGQESTNWIGPFQQVSKTTQKGNQLDTDWHAVVNNQHVRGHWTRTLSADGKSMTLDIQQSTDDGKSGTGKLVFKKR